MSKTTEEYAYYQEGFEIFAFKYKIYGCGKWAATYDEAHELAKEAVLKKCMEENPHLAFQNKNDDLPAVVKDDLMTTTYYPNGDMKSMLNKTVKFKGTINPETPFDLIREINSCKSPTVLKIYHKQTIGNPEAAAAYFNKLSELNKTKETV